MVSLFKDSREKSRFKISVVITAIIMGYLLYSFPVQTWTIDILIGTSVISLIIWSFVFVVIAARAVTWVRFFDGLGQMGENFGRNIIRRNEAEREKRKIKEAVKEALEEEKRK